MPSLSTTRVTATQEEPDTGEEAAVAAATRLHVTNESQATTCTLS